MLSSKQIAFKLGLQFACVSRSSWSSGCSIISSRTRPTPSRAPCLSGIGGVSINRELDVWMGDAALLRLPPRPTRLILSLIRGSQARGTIDPLEQRVSSVCLMPRAHATGTRLRVPSTSCESGAIRGLRPTVPVYANSKPAFAILWPLNRAKRAARSVKPAIGCAINVCAR